MEQKMELKGEGVMLPVVERRIIPAWTDYNGHLNVTWIAHLFDLGTDSMLDSLGIGEAYAARTGHSTFVLEGHVSYLGEALLNDDVQVYSTVLGADSKRLKYCHHLVAAGDKRVIARLEQISIHVDLAERRSLPWPKEIRRRLGASTDGDTAESLCAGLRLKPEQSDV